MEKHRTIVEAERRVKDLIDSIHYATTSLTHLLVKAYRNGMSSQSGEVAYTLLDEAVSKSEEAFQNAIAQPENKIATRPEVSL